MRLFLVFLAVVILSALASSRWLLQVGRAFLLAQLAASGLLFLTFGALAGPEGLGVLSSGDLAAMAPLLALCLGVCGAIVGLNLDLGILRRLPARAYLGSAAQSAAAFLAVAAPMGAVLALAPSARLPGVLGAAAMLGGAASVSSAHYAVLWSRAGRMDRLRGMSMALVAMLDDLAGLLALAVALAIAAASNPLFGLALLAEAAVLGLSCGLLVIYLQRGVQESAEVVAVLLGGAALVSGAAAYLRISALLAGVAFGATLCLSGEALVRPAYRFASRVERPVYLFLLFVIGAHLDGGDALAWILLPAFVACRFVGKILGGRAAARLTKGALSLPPEPGFALLAQGGLSLCIAVEYLLLVRSPNPQLIFDVVVLAALVNEALAARTLGMSLEPRGARAAGAA